MRNRIFILLILGAILLGGGYVWRGRYLGSTPVPPQAETPGNPKGEQHRSAGPIPATSASAPAVPTPKPDTRLSEGLEQQTAATLEAPSLEAEVEDLDARVKRAVAQLTRLSSEQVQAALLEAIRARDEVMLNVAKNELIARAKRSDATAVEAIRSAVGQVSSKQQAYFIGILGEIATPNALVALIEILEAPAVDKSEAWYAALDAVGSIGRYRDQNVSPEQLSVLLEDYFEAKSPEDPHLAAALASGLSTVGTERGVDWLLRYMAEHEAGKLMDPGLAKAMTASLTKVRNPAAVLPLQARLQEDPRLEGRAARAAGAALAAMGNARATEALLRWASQLTEKEQTKQALAWLSEVRDEQSIQFLLRAEDWFQFRDPELLAGITALAKKIDEESTPKLVQ
ncbi:MAG: hypothetical protein ACREYF_06300 [Gammaproteobacteria bacterium]